MLTVYAHLQCEKSILHCQHEATQGIVNDFVILLLILALTKQGLTRLKRTRHGTYISYGRTQHLQRTIMYTGYCNIIIPQHYTRHGAIRMLRRRIEKALLTAITWHPLICPARRLYSYLSQTLHISWYIMDERDTSEARQTSNCVTQGSPRPTEKKGVLGRHNFHRSY